MSSSPHMRPTLGAVLLLAAAIATTASAHAAWTSPRSRGTLNTNALDLPKLGLKDVPKSDCPHCLNGGGKGGVMAAAKNNWVPWDPMDKTKPFRHDAGLCGDPIKDPKPRKHEKGGMYGPPKGMPLAAVYKSGQEVGFQVTMSTHHNGFFEFFICDVDKCGGDISEKCFSGGHCRKLLRSKVPECESKKSMHCGPIDPDHPGRWIMPCRQGPHVGIHKMGGAGKNRGRYMQYKLPEGFACENCVMQWYWASANSCNPPGFKEYFEKYPMKAWGKCPGDGGALGARNPTLATCGGPTFPEEFWNCADVRVNSNGGTGGGATTEDAEDDDDEAAEEGAAEEPQSSEAPEPVSAEDLTPVQNEIPSEEQQPTTSESAQETVSPASQTPATPVENAKEAPSTSIEQEGESAATEQANQNQGATEEQRRVQREQEEIRRKQQAEVMRKRALAKQNAQQTEAQANTHTFPVMGGGEGAVDGEKKTPEQAEQTEQPSLPLQSQQPQETQLASSTVESKTMGAGETDTSLEEDFPVTGASTGSEMTAAKKDGCKLDSSARMVEDLSAVGAACAGRWRQCGGTGYSGVTPCCSPNFECVSVSAGDSFAMCKPVVV